LIELPSISISGGFVSSLEEKYAASVLDEFRHYPKVSFHIKFIKKRLSVKKFSQVIFTPQSLKIDQFLITLNFTRLFHIANLGGNSILRFIHIKEKYPFFS